MTRAQILPPLHKLLLPKMATSQEFIAVEFSLETYEARAAQAKADAELAAAQTVQKMIDAGFTQEEIDAVLQV